jgi:hypothetical protein
VICFERAWEKEIGEPEILGKKSCPNRNYGLSCYFVVTGENKVQEKNRIFLKFI